MQNQLEYKLVNNFKCKRCGCIHYDKIIYTGMKTLGDEDSIIYEKYVCRNCDYMFNINDYMQQDIIEITPKELLEQSHFVDEGTEIKINDEIIKKENINE